MDVVRIAATAHILNYLPEYYAESAGLFADRGLQVPAYPQEPWTRVLDDIDSGATDLALCGLWVPAMFTGIRPNIAVIGQLNARCPMAIVSREPVPGFSLSWLLGRTLLIPGYTGTVPYVFTAGLLRAAGLDPAGVRFVRDLSRETLLELFTAGVGDAILVDMLTACRLQHEGQGSIAYHLADGGVMSNSVYCVRRDRIDSLREPLTAFLSAIESAMSILSGGKPDAVDGLLEEHWPDADLDVVREAAGYLMGDGTWEGVRIDPDGCLRMSTMVYDCGLALRPAGYADLVDDSLLPALGA
jgi:NitT/TauT family transport system substrate-binding protein